MVASIPASAIVSVTPSVITAGGTALQLSGLVLTASTRVPIGSVISFGSALAVSAYFGASSQEAAAAAIYFLGFDGSSIKPAAMLFAQYPTAPVPAYLRGASVAGLTLAQLQALSGTITLTVNGNVATSATINLAAATSFSNAATLIQSGFTTPAFTVSYDSVSGAFVFTDTITGATGTITAATGSLATPLALTTATGAVTSQGAAASTPVAAMAAIVGQTQNFAAFTTLFEPSTADCVSFPAWTNSTLDRFLYVMWDSDPTVIAPNPTSSAGYLIQQAGYNGTLPLYCPDFTKAAFVLSIGASLDYTALGGRATYKFRAQSGLVADVTSLTAYQNLVANGYSAYCAFATAAQGFVGLADGAVTGQFLWADSYINQIQLNNALQLALMSLLFNVKSVPYNDAGYSLIETACSDPIQAALRFGSIQPNVNLSALQIAEIIAQAGIDCSVTVQTRGWYLSIQPAPASLRAARQSPPCAFIYVDGESVQVITLNSIQVQ